MLIEIYARVNSAVVFKAGKFFMYGIITYSCQTILTGEVSTESSSISSLSLFLEFVIL